MTRTEGRSRESNLQHIDLQRQARGKEQIDGKHKLKKRRDPDGAPRGGLGSRTAARRPAAAGSSGAAPQTANWCAGSRAASRPSSGPPRTARCTGGSRCQGGCARRAPPAASPAPCSSKHQFSSETRSGGCGRCAAQEAGEQRCLRVTVEIAWRWGETGREYSLVRDLSQNKHRLE